MNRFFLLPTVRILAVIGLLLPGLVNVVPCEAQETIALQEKIDQQGAGWIAEDNEISRLPAAERKKRLGTIIDPDAELLMAPSAAHFMAFGDGPLPAKLDYRDFQGQNYVTPVRNQGSCGSCWAFATTAALESAVLRAYNRPGENVDLAEQVLISCGEAGGCGGGSPYSASIFLKKTGIPPESCYPYTKSNGTCGGACGDRLSTSFTITDYHFINRSVQDLKAALNTYGPITTAYYVYQDFSKYKSGVYRYVSGEGEGGHAVLLVGYDDDLQAFICKNSWSRGWGEDGYFKIHYDMVTHEKIKFGTSTYAYTGAVDPSRTNQPPQAQAGADNDVREGERVTLNGNNSRDQDGHIVSYQWRRTAGPNVDLIGSDTATPEFTAPDTDDPDGITLTFRLTVTDDAGATDSDSVSVRVLRNNQPPIAAANASSPVTEGETVTLSGTNSTDPENGVLSFRWSQLSGPDVVLSDETAATCTFTAPDTNDPDGIALTFQLTVTDDGNLSRRADVTVNVNWHNLPPVASAGDDLHLSEGETVVLNGENSTDPESHPLTYRWSQLSGETVTLSDPLAAVTEFTAPSTSDTDSYALRFSLEVEDNAGLKATDEIIVNISWINDPPTAAATGPQTAPAGDVITLDGSGSVDGDDGISSYQWRQVSGTPVTLSTPDQSTTTFTAPDAEEGTPIELQFELTVTDAGGLSGTAGIAVTVHAPGDAPVLPPEDQDPLNPDSEEQPNTGDGGGGSSSGCWIWILLKN